MRDGYMRSDPRFIAWQNGERNAPEDNDPALRPWLGLIAELVGRGIEIRRARIVSEPVSDYIAFEHHVTAANVTAGESVRCLPRRQASDIAVPGNDFWLPDGRVAVFEQTRTGGVIVAPWGTEYGGEAIARLVVADDGTASGRFTRSSAFMRLRQQRPVRPPHAAYLNGREWPADGVRSSTALSPAEVGGWLEQFAIGLRVPGAFWTVERYEGGAYTLWTYSTDTKSWASADYVPGADSYEVYQSGPRRLWDETEAAYRWWADAGRPWFDRFGLTVDGDHAKVWLDWPDNPA